MNTSLVICSTRVDCNTRTYLWAALLVAVSIGSVRAQTFEIAWFTIDAGGGVGTTTDGFEVVGAFGQADASDALTGGIFEIRGGFWPVNTLTAATIASANPPTDNPYVAAQQPFRDVLQTGTRTTLTQGIGATGTPAEGSTTYSTIAVTFSEPPVPVPGATNINVDCTIVGISDCCVAHAGTGCDDATCEASVCDEDLACCSIQWDGICAGEAGLLCPDLCSDDCPTVTQVSGSGSGPYILTLSGPIPPPQCTTFTFAGMALGQKLQYQYLPGDVDMSGTPNTQDTNAMTQALNNGTANLPANLARYDVNRSGAANTQDLLRIIQLLNGSNTTQVWNGVSVVTCP